MKEWGIEEQKKHDLLGDSIAAVDSVPRLDPDSSEQKEGLKQDKR